MNDEIELDGRKYSRTQGQWYDERRISVPASLSRRLEQEWRQKRSTTAPHPAEQTALVGPKKPARRPSRHSLYQRVYPIIAGLIRRMYAERQGWSNHREIVAALSQHPEARLLIAEIAADQGNTTAWTANNIVQWFSADYTKGQSDYLDDFERQRVDGVWAYRPAGA